MVGERTEKPVIVFDICVLSRIITMSKFTINAAKCGNEDFRDSAPGEIASPLIFARIGRKWVRNSQKMDFRTRPNGQPANQPGGPHSRQPNALARANAITFAV
ncbi:hypothetical protein ACTNEM_05235 [Eubacterium pyruvativorans]|uniref:hypothetical protein n=1 Tax=Eubacterium pyruvativorans TaxID=155865 RepID=UPI003F889C6F